MTLAVLNSLTWPIGLSTTTATMRVIHQHTGLSDANRGAAVAIGNFDGIHRGHQALIGEAARVASDLAALHGILTFAPHPRSYFRPSDAPFQLTPPASKTRHLRTMGVDLMYVLPFDRALAEMAAEKFVSDVLIGGLGAKHLVVGYNFVFGVGRKGDVELLRRIAAGAGVGVTIIEAVKGSDGSAFSSTVIRNCLKEGKPAAAAALLGRCWEIEGSVQTGEQRGRQIGFPTANVDPGEYLHPRVGVYAVWAGVTAGEETEWHMAVANVGYRPTFDGEGITVEVHIFDFSSDLYGRQLRVALVDFLRPERKFDGIDEIRAQITEDCVKARTVLEAVPEGDYLKPPCRAAALAL